MEEDLPQLSRHSIRTTTKENFNKTSEVEFGTQTNFIHNNIYVKNDVFEAFYEDYLEYKGYVNDILNTLIHKDDILHRIEKENTTEYSKKIKSLQNQIEDSKKENKVFKEILTSKFDFNQNNVSNNNIDNTWLKPAETILSITKSTTGDLILLMSVINITLFLSTKMK